MTEELSFSWHAIGRYFSRYGVKITPEELLYIQSRIRYGQDDIKHSGKIKTPDDFVFDCYHGTHNDVEFFALCSEGEYIIMTFYKAEFLFKNLY